MNLNCWPELWVFLLVNYLQLVFSETCSMQKKPVLQSEHFEHYFACYWWFWSDCFYDASLWSTNKIILVLQSWIVFLVNSAAKSLLLRFLLFERMSSKSQNSHWSRGGLFLHARRNACCVSATLSSGQKLQDFCFAVNWNGMCCLYSLAPGSFKLCLFKVQNWCTLPDRILVLDVCLVVRVDWSQFDSRRCVLSHGQELTHHVTWRRNTVLVMLSTFLLLRLRECAQW